ncbi:MAG: arcB, partial [Gemmataceae bacterium]|nr:arcB [Gemmataceae bacterium]
MTRRLLGPVGGPIIYFLVAGLVFAGLGWVTVAALRVEEAQRQSAARADLEKDVQGALWRLDGRVLPALGVEDSRPFYHYTNYAPEDPTTAYGPPCAPLLAAELPAWMRLHFQVDPDAGWQSPQVLTAEAADRLRRDWPGLDPRNATPERAKLVTALRAKYQTRAVIDVFAARERAVPSGAGALPAWLFVEGAAAAPGEEPAAPPAPTPAP